MIKQLPRYFRSEAYNLHWGYVPIGYFEPPKHEPEVRDAISASKQTNKGEISYDNR